MKLLRTLLAVACLTDAVGVAEARAQTSRPSSRTPTSRPISKWMFSPHPVLPAEREETAAALREMTIPQLDAKLHAAPEVSRAHLVIDELVRRPGEEAAAVLKRYQTALDAEAADANAVVKYIIKPIRGVTRVGIALQAAGGDRRARLDALAKLLDEPDETSAPDAAAWELQQIGGPEAIEILRRGEVSGNISIRMSRIALEYADLDDEKFVQAIVAEATESLRVGRNVVAENSSLGPPRVTEKLIAPLRHALAEERADLPDELRAKVRAFIEDHLARCEWIVNGRTGPPPEMRRL